MGANITHIAGGGTMYRGGRISLFPQERSKKPAAFLDGTGPSGSCSSSMSFNKIPNDRKERDASRMTELEGGSSFFSPERQEVAVNEKVSSRHKVHIPYSLNCFGV